MFCYIHDVNRTYPSSNSNVVVVYLISGTVRIEMFRNMQNAEIIRKMTEEFDEVCFPRVFKLLLVTLQRLIFSHFF